MDLIEQFYQKALANAQAKNFSVALDWVQKMHTIAPNNDSVYLVEAAIHMEAENYTACAEASKECILLNEANGSGWNHLGVSMCYMNHIPEGVDCFKRAMALNTPGASDNYYFWSSKI